MAFDKLLGLDEHPARTAAGVVDAALDAAFRVGIRLEHLDHGPDDRARGVELAAALALGAGELAQEVLVDTAQDVSGFVLAGAKGDSRDKVDQFTEHHRVEGGAGVLLG